MTGQKFCMAVSLTIAGLAISATQSAAKDVVITGAIKEPTKSERAAPARLKPPVDARAQKEPTRLMAPPIRSTKLAAPKVEKKQSATLPTAAAFTVGEEPTLLITPKEAPLAEAALDETIAKPTKTPLAQPLSVKTTAKPANAAPIELASDKKPAKSLYPEAAKARSGPLAKALGPAGYALSDVGISEDFRTAIKGAVAAHPVYHAQLASRDEARADRRREQAALYPQLSTQLRGDYSLSREFAANTDNVVESLRPAQQFAAAISASQLVFDGGATFQRIKSARARSEETKNALSTRINDLSLGALAAYHDLLTHQALISLGEAFIVRHEKILSDVKERERLGAGSKADVTQTLARLSAARARVEEIRESKQLAEIQYIEYFKDTPGKLSRPSFEGVVVNSRDAAISMATSRHPEIAAAQARAAATTADFKAARGARLPELRVSLDATKFDIFDGTDDFDVRAGVNLNYDIYTGGGRRADIASARARAEREKHSTEQVRQDIIRDAAIAYERRQGAEARLAALETAVINHDKTRKLVLERYRVSRGDLIDVLQAENDYFESAISYLTGLANRDMSIYGLMEHTGDLLRYFSPQSEYDGYYPGDANVQ